ncbi:hypothetical protein VIGAN_07148000 [Vigna angularis var. angularis]|uniref:Uncharacterized protein n=1 Tax=Vigna angularis var. angularis TaxID=157739 RepID=A0A0S3SIT7_PHAAN|nr:hypothetical protein VIGAN_07148000 [Vigna angularis var. angularis]
MIPPAPCCSIQQTSNNTIHEATSQQLHTFSDFSSLLRPTPATRFQQLETHIVAKWRKGIQAAKDGAHGFSTSAKHCKKTWRVWKEDERSR